MALTGCSATVVRPTSTGAVGCTRPAWSLAGETTFSSGGEVDLEGETFQVSPFTYDQFPVSRGEYDSCVDANRCPERQIEQPMSASYAVGMTRDAMQAYCEARCMRLPTRPEQRLLRETLGPETYLLDGPGIPGDIVQLGVRCVREDN